WLERERGARTGRQGRGRERGSAPHRGGGRGVRGGGGDGRHRGGGVGDPHRGPAPPEWKLRAPGGAGARRQGPVRAVHPGDLGPRLRGGGGAGGGAEGRHGPGRTAGAASGSEAVVVPARQGALGNGEA